MSSSRPPFDRLWSDPVACMEPEAIKSTLGGNLGSLTNLCCVRLSHALRHAGHPVSGVASDFADKHGHKYIIRVATMRQYLTSKYGAPLSVTEASARSKRGIVLFEVHFTDATGHVDLWNRDRPAKQQFWERAHAVWLWEC
jgi:Type VI secretion system (T6SS), amidase effector protein 4